MRWGIWVAFTHSGRTRDEQHESTAIAWFVVAVGEAGDKVLAEATENIRSYSLIPTLDEAGEGLVYYRLKNLVVRQIMPLGVPRGLHRALLRRTWICGTCGGIGPDFLTVKNHAGPLEHGKPIILYDPDRPPKPERPECSQPVLLESPLREGLKLIRGGKG